MRKLSMLLLGLSLVFAQVLSAQSRVVTGKVTDANGAPVSGASVNVKNTKGGTSAATDGTFKINAAPNAVLVVSAVGFETQEINIGQATNVSVTLKVDAKGLGEVILTGTGAATTKKKLGFSVESIKSDKLPILPAATIDQALIGKIPGANISSISGNPGDQVSIVLRGINTVLAGTRPLILLDGVEVPFSSLQTLDMTQIDRVEVVQGAASATIYGAQGANGVIQIFSKKGQKGKMAINFSSSVANGTFINSGNFGKAKLHPYLTDANGNLISRLSSGGFTPGQALQINPVLGFLPGSGSIAYKYGVDIPGLSNPIPGLGNSYARYGILDPRNNANQPYKGNLQFHDHFAEVFTGSKTLNNTLSISGGADKVDYNIALSNNQTSSPFLENNGKIKRTNLTSNIGVELFKGFTLRAVTSLTYVENDMHPGLGAPGGLGFGRGESNAGVGLIYGFLNTSPFFSLKDTIQGGLYAAYQRASFLSVNASNPYYQLMYTKGDSKQYIAIQNFDANYKVNHFLTLNAKYGVSFRTENDIWTYYNQTLNESTNYWGSETAGYLYNNIDNTGELINYQYFNTRQNFLATALIATDFQKDFGLKLPITTSTQLSFDWRKNLYKEYNTRGYSLPINPPFNMNSTQSQYIITDYVEPFVTYGFLVDQKFDYEGYGGITAGVRTDYSSAFGAGSKPFAFPHFNGYLNLPAFKFWSKLSDRIPSFKLRAAYGQAGIQPAPFDRYPTLIAQPTGNELSYANDNSQRNPNLDVEVSTEKEFGFDFSVSLLKGNWLKNINFSQTIWNRNTKNAIFFQNVAPSTGATSVVTNAIGLSSKGWQASVNIPVFGSKNLTWDFTANFSRMTSMIDNVVGGAIPLESSAGSTNVVIAPGRRIGEIYGYKALTSVGQLRQDKTPFIAPADQSNYEIVNGRVVNKITKAIFFSDEAESIGYTDPDFISSFINSLTYKNTITLGFQLDWIQGAHLYNQTKEWMFRDGIHSDFAKPVTINGETGAWSAYYASAYYALGATPSGVGNNVTKDFFYYNSSYVRLRNLSVGVDFARFAKKNWLKKTQVVFSGRNLMTWTKYDGMDPEINSSNPNVAFDRGIDHSTIPNMKSYQLTLNLGF